MKNFIAIITMLGIFCISYSAAGQLDGKKDIQTYLDRGESYLYAQNFENAIKEFERAVKIFPSSVQAHYLLAYAYWNYGVRINREGNKKHLLDAFMSKDVKHRLEPEKRDYYKRSREYMKKSTEQYKIILTLDPTHWISHYMVATHHSNNKRYDEAIEGYKRSIKYNNKYANSYSGIASAYHNKGLYNLAETNFKKAISLDPDFEYAYYQLGETYLVSGQMQKALEILEHLRKEKFIFYDDFKRSIDLHRKKQAK